MKIQRNCLQRTIKKINDWWNEDLFVINISIFEITVDNGMIFSLMLIIVGLISLI